jgi:hypothetical protein
MKLTPHRERWPFYISRQNAPNQILLAHDIGGQLPPLLHGDLDIQRCRAAATHSIRVDFMVIMENDGAPHALPRRLPYDFHVVTAKDVREKRRFVLVLREKSVAIVHCLVCMEAAAYDRSSNRTRGRFPY